MTSLLSQIALALNPFYLAWRIEAALDRLALRRKLAPQGLLGARSSRDLEALLLQRISEARDLFVQRGVTPRRDSVLELAKQSIAADYPAVVRIQALVVRIRSERTAMQRSPVLVSPMIA